MTKPANGRAKKTYLTKQIEDWKAYENPLTGHTYEQVDDIVVIGLRNV